MKKLLLFAFAVFAFAACTQNDVEELSANRADVPETLTVGFEGGDDTRIQLNSAQKTVWTKDDLVSVFYFSNANQKWQYQGETGERIGRLKRVEYREATTETTYNVVVYPYSDNYFLNPRTCAIHATLPAVQHYAEDSYGVGDNLMVSQSEFTQFTLKNVCGWLKLQLTGNGERVQSITLRGNNEEQLAGLIYVDTDTAESILVSEMGGFDDIENSVGGGLMFDDAIVTELTLDCGDGVELGEEAKSFYIAVPPQTFEQGITVDIVCDGYKPMTLTTTSELVIERNHIKPMESVAFAAEAMPDVVMNVTKVRAKMSDQGKTWVLTFTESDPILGSPMTDIVISLKTANVRYLTSGTYGKYKKGEGFREGTYDEVSTERSGSVYRYNVSGYAAAIGGDDREFTIEVNEVAQTARISAHFITKQWNAETEKWNDVNVIIEWEGNVSGFAYTDPSEEVTEWTSFSIVKSNNSLANHTWNRIEGKAKNGTSVIFDLYSPTGEAYVLPAGEYKVCYFTENKMSENFICDTGDPSFAFASKVNGYGLKSGSVTVEDVDGGQKKVTYNLVDINGINLKGTYIGTLQNTNIME